MKKQLSLLEKIENSKKLAVFVLVLYICLLCLVSYYHEPWHDEGQAWLIARDDSIWHLITVTAHYEGHPPLWHFILMPFAKMGVPFELGLKSINITLCSIAMWLLICKSPLPFYLRYLLPFTYFFFYQYGVVNRTYSLLMLAMMLVAYYYPARDRKPYKLALALSALCGTMAYGSMIALGIALAWLSEKVVKLYKEGNKSIKALADDSEVRALAMLLCISLFWAYCIIPRADTNFLDGGLKVNLISDFLFSFFVIPGQALCTNDIKDAMQIATVKFFYDNIKMYLHMFASVGFYAILMLINYLVSYFYGVLIQFSFCYITYVTGRLKLYLLPICAYALLASYVHWVPYHAGIVVAFLVFILWQLFADKSALKLLAEHLSKQFKKKREYNFCKKFVVFAVLGCMFIGISWSFTASRVDIGNSYDISRDVANFIKENKLEGYNFWTRWYYIGHNEDNIDAGAYAINAYFKNTIIKNDNIGNGSGPAYHQERVVAKADFLNNMRMLPQPDFLLGEAQINEVYEHPANYVKIHNFSCVQAWKRSTSVKGDIDLYIREDLLTQFPQFHVLEKDEK